MKTKEKVKYVVIPIRDLMIAYDVVSKIYPQFAIWLLVNPKIFQKKS